MTVDLSRKDPSQNFIEHHALPLDAFFQPASVAVIGAKDDQGTVGRTIMANLLAGKLEGRIYPVNPKRSEVLGIKAYPSVSALPEVPELAVIITPASTVPGVVDECGEASIKAAIVISAGFKEVGEKGLALEHKMLANARKHGMRIVGPNCLGIMNPVYGLNATFAKGMALPGNLAFISQSGAMCTAVLDWSFSAKVGFSAFVSIGSMADVNWGDLISYLGSQPTTQSILIYMETIGDPRSFLSAAREIALEKPIIVIKPGRSEAAAHAAASHTGALAGSDEVFEAALERVGTLRVNTIGELFSMASVLARQPKPRGPKLAIVTNAGGPSVLATDATVLNGAEMATLPKQTVEELNKVLPIAWSHSNPVDILGDALPDRYGKAIDILMKEDAIDGLLVVLSPQDVTDPVGSAECLSPYGSNKKKPILASWMGGGYVLKGVEILNQSHIPTFEYPDDAARTFAMMWQYSHNLKGLYEVPPLRDTLITEPARQEVGQILAKVREEAREILTEFESKKVLSLYGIPCVETLTAFDSASAVYQANAVGYPVVLKLFSETITHKTDVGGVKLNLKNAQAVEEAFEEIKESVTRIAGEEHFGGVTVQRMVKRDGYEIILGSSTDPQFGPVLLFGTGGQLVEVYKDRALGLPPLNGNLAYRLMAKTKIYQALKGVRGRASIDIEKLVDILVHFSQFIVEHAWVKECDINPILASEREIIALDARIILHPANTPENKLPRAAIRPYPVEYITSTTLKDGTVVILRPIRPEDEPAAVEFHKELSERSVRQRYFEFVSLSERVAHERLSRICFSDYDREMAIVATLEDDSNKILGVARLIRLPIEGVADVKIIIIDAYHNKGLGLHLLQTLIEIAQKEKLTSLQALVLSENEGMIHLCRKLGFHQEPHPDPSLSFLVKQLTQKETACSSS